MWKYGMVSDISVDYFSKSHKTWPKRERERERENEIHCNKKKFICNKKHVIIKVTS